MIIIELGDCQWASLSDGKIEGKETVTTVKIKWYSRLTLGGEKCLKKKDEV
jgi:hypothetical protein